MAGSESSRAGREMAGEAGTGAGAGAGAGTQVAEGGTEDLARGGAPFCPYQPGGATSLGGAGGAGGFAVEPPLEPSPDCHHPPVVEDCRDGFCRIEPGCFIMGAPRSEWYAARYEDVQVQVTLTHPFEIGQTEATRALWESVGWAQPIQFENYSRVECNDVACPQANVNFFDVVSFANRYSEQQGLLPCYELSGCSGTLGAGPRCWSGGERLECEDVPEERLRCDLVTVTAANIYECEGYRLPTEAEWEYAARAGTRTAFYAGDILDRSDEPEFLGCFDEPGLRDIGWYCDNSNNQVHPVAQKAPNCWGLFDVLGNVAEWTNSVSDGNGYGEGPLVDPTGTLSDGPERMPPNVGFFQRVARGGAFNLPPMSEKVNTRSSHSDKGYGDSAGFRLARTLPK